MADDLIGIHRHQRDGQGPRRPQSIDDVGLVAAAVGRTLERRGGQLMDEGCVLGTLRSDLQFSESLKGPIMGPCASDAHRGPDDGGETLRRRRSAGSNKL